MAHSTQWCESPNYRAGRNGRKIIAIVDHITSGQFPGCLNWLCNPSAQVSAHYLINRSGEIYQLVKDENTAWHAGVVNKPSWRLYDKTNPNQYTLGIEHEGYGTLGGDGNITEAQYIATLWLHSQLTNKYDIPINRDYIIGHYQIDSVDRANCPGVNFPWSRLINDLEKGDTVVGDTPLITPDWKKEIMDQAYKEGLITDQNHEPDDIASKWFVLKVALNLLDKIQNKK